MADITNVKLIDLIPTSLKSDPDVLASVEAIDGELSAVSALCEVPAIRSRINELSSQTLDHLAWQVDSKIWRDSWPLSLKQSVINTVIVQKSKKGTLSAVKKALASLGSQAVVKEWFQYTPEKTPHTFDITISLNNAGEQPDSEFLEDLTLILDDVKPARSTYTLSLATQAQSAIGLFSAARSGVYARLDGKEAL